MIILNPLHYFIFFIDLEVNPLFIRLQGEKGIMAAIMAEQRSQNITRVVSEYGTRLFNFISGRVPTNEDAEDILQEVWYQFSRVVDIESIEQVSGWLYRVARNRITDRYRKKREDLIVDQQYEDEDGMTALGELLLIDDNTPETELLKEIVWESLFQALEELPEEQRDVFVWNELEDETFREISDRTGINIKTLISRKRYAVLYLRERLQSLYDEFLLNA